MEKDLNFIIALPRSYRLYNAELKRRYDDSVHHLLKFLKNIKFLGLIEHVMTAACMYPRCQQTCEDEISNLGYAIVDFVDTDYGRMSSDEMEAIRRLVVDVGREVLMQLSAAGYYDEFVREPLLANQDLDYHTNMTGISTLRQVRDCVFQVTVQFHYTDDRPKFNGLYVHNQSRMVH